MDDFGPMKDAAAPLSVVRSGVLVNRDSVRGNVDIIGKNKRLDRNLNVEDTVLLLSFSLRERGP